MNHRVSLTLILQVVALAVLFGRGAMFIVVMLYAAAVFTIVAFKFKMLLIALAITYQSIEARNAIFLGVEKGMSIIRFLGYNAEYVIMGGIICAVVVISFLSLLIAGGILGFSYLLNRKFKFKERIGL